MRLRFDTLAQRFRAGEGEAEALSPVPAELDRAEWQRQLAAAYRPILSGLVLPASIYYLIVVILHYFTETPQNFRILGVLAGVAALAGLVISWHLRRRDLSYVKIEFYSLLFYGLIFANIVVHHLLHLEVPKLVYFVLLTLAVATTGISLRLVVPIVVASLATSILLAAPAGPDVQQQFGYIALASTFISIGIASLMRLAIKREIRARVRAEQLHETAKMAAEVDFLTGLPNRRRFFSKLESALSDPEASRQMALGIVDLNGFKAVNDVYGHAFGDRLLIEVGNRLIAACGSGVFVARLGGDEFAMLVESADSEARLQALGTKIRDQVGQGYLIDGTELAITASVGFAPNIPTIVAPSQLYEHADFALYKAKESRDDAIQVFSSADEAALDSIKRVEQNLNSGALEDEMFVEYQPLVHVPDARVIGFEALARWQSPQLGRVPPDIFIRAAERSGCISRLTPILLRKALADARTWPKDLRLSFNLSARDVVAKNSMQDICGIVARSGFAGDRLDFEITETSIMTDYERVRSALGCIRKLGARVALDDFGVGYANFQHLDELKIDKLKIDRHFVTHLGTSSYSDRIMRTMVEMCTGLGMTCVVEGVETETQLQAVTEAGASIIQGFYFGRPMTADRIGAFLAAGVATPGAPERRLA